MRILHLIPSLSGGGAERQLQLILPLLEQQGYENHVLYLYGDDHRTTFCLPNSQLHHFPVNSNYSPRILLKIIRLIHVIRPNIIHSWIMQMDILAGIVSCLYNIPWVLREPSCADAGYNHWKFRIRAKLGSRARAIIANSTEGRDYWQKIYPNKEIHIIQNILPITEINNQPSLGRRSLDLNESQKIILFAGRLDAGKNLKILFEALFPLLQKNPNLTFIICGNGVDQPMLKETATGAGVSRQTRFMGHVAREKLWGIMKTADAFAFISLFEGLPNAVIEAAACGAPLLLSDIPAHRNLFDEASARFVPADNASAIRTAIAEMLSGDCTGQVANARRQIARFAGEAIIEQYKTFYHKTLEGSNA
ncbi:MAG: glycosyltransferase [Lentisphaerota bacterium]